MPPETDRTVSPTPKPDNQNLIDFLSKVGAKGSESSSLSSLDFLRKDNSSKPESLSGGTQNPLAAFTRHSAIECHQSPKGLSAAGDNWNLWDRLSDLFRPKGPVELPDNEPLPKLIINGKEENYPKSKKLDITEKYGDTKVADPYQWLEETKKPDTESWVKQQTALTEKYLASIPERAKLHERLEKIYNYEQRSNMWKQDGKYYLWKQDGLKQQPELCVVDSFNGTPKTIFDPNTLSKDGHGIARDVRLTNDGKYAVFRFADGGQDATRTVIYDINAKAEIKELPKGEHTSGPQKETSVKMPDDTTRDYKVSGESASKNKLVYTDSKTGKEKEVIPEGKDELLDAQIVGNKIIAHYLKDACSELKVYDLDGKFERQISLPGRGTVSNINGSANDKELLFTYSNFTTPNTPFRCDVETGKTEAQFTPKPPFNPNDFETEEKTATSKDGTPIHLFIVHKKGLELNGKNPTYLHGYGGFQINRTPIFDNGNMPWLQDGGILVVANLRGGKEYGEDWHKAGMRDKKQNVFDDFISSAEYLVKNKYTDGSHLAIGGRSNGGLLVGATLVQRPDLFAAAIPEVGLFDMLRFPKIGPGAWWESEYGYPSDPQDFKTFMKYSPLQNLKRGVGLPAVLTMTNANDDRVIPAHSFKFVAAAQRAQGNEKNPVLLYVGQGCGHGPEKYTSELVDEYANKWAFLKQSMENAGKAKK